MRRKKKSKKAFYLFLFFAVTGISIGILSYQKSLSDQKYTADDIQSNIEATEIDSAQVNMKTSTVKISEIDNAMNLWLVNKDYAIPNKAAVNTVSAYKRVALSRADIDLSPETLLNTERMFAAAKKENFSGYVVTSGFRTKEKQTELYQDATDKSYVSLPNHSEHQTGLAIDVQLINGGIRDFGETSQGKWLMNNAYKFGFILRYPEDKIAITGISYEPWHFRYVGLPHAAFMKNNNLCFEEYIDWLREHDGYEISVDGNDYQIYRIISKNGKVAVPSYGNYEISDDNTGGYIITIKK